MFDTKEDPPEWKDRGVGNIRILKHKQTGVHRTIMRRDKTKICAITIGVSTTDCVTYFVVPTGKLQYNFT